FKITGITNGTLFQNDGLTPIVNGEFITTDDGGAGLKFTPSANFNGTGFFSIQASTAPDDSGLGGNVIVATITVLPADDPPTAVNDSFTIQRSAFPQALAVLANDSSAPDGPEKLFVVSVSPTKFGGTVTTDGVSVFYKAPNGFVGTDTFTYTLGDSGGP